MPRTIKLTLQYDGTDYVGWQRQASGTSIQGLLEDALQPVEGGRVMVHGAGRTDAGVHALGQVCSFVLQATIGEDVLPRALNAVLPLDVRVLSVKTVPDDFHARFSATGKRYRYRVLNTGPGSPFDKRYSWHVPQALDFDQMGRAAQMLQGEHDFAAFAAAGTPVSSTTRTLASLRITRETAPWQAGGVLVTFDVEGDGFLRHMVRTIVGTLVEIGLGRWPSSAIPDMLARRDRSRTGTTAPAAGLFLVEVFY